jgi:hypothetical protein
MKITTVVYKIAGKTIRPRTATPAQNAVIALAGSVKKLTVCKNSERESLSEQKTIKRAGL